jgi:branched-subunit amino acid aminotransferase/4-amino-4-deoxychorismate lyase
MELENADAIFLTSAATGIRAAALNGENENAAPDALIEHLTRRWYEAVNDRI